MDTSAIVEPQVDVERLAHQLKLPYTSVHNTLEMLDDENTVPFITRYRKDRTGALDEDAIRKIKDGAEKQRLLLQRKETILKSIKSQGKLSDSLAERIQAADSTKLLEDLYLAYKPKKRSLATLARQLGLEPLANDLLHASLEAADLEKRAAEFFNPDNQLVSTADVLSGVGHIVAEWFSERADARGTLRDIFRRTGRLCTRRYITSDTSGSANEKDSTPKRQEAEGTPAQAPTQPGNAQADSVPAESPEKPVAACEPAASVVAAGSEEAAGAADGATSRQADPATTSSLSSEPSSSAASSVATVPVEVASSVDANDLSTPSPDVSSAPHEEQPAEHPPQEEAAAQVPQPAAKERVTAAERRRQQRREIRERKRRKLEQAFKDYFEYEESLSRVPHHRVLAINRGERTRVLRVKIDADFEAMHREAEQMLVSDDHPHASFLRDCVRDALTRLLLPSLEREIRRELTQLAEEHAISVFAQNLRKLLLQPPAHGRRVLAMDPGFRNGCKLAALDEFGNVLDHGVVYVIGNEERRAEGRNRLVEMIRKHAIGVVAIGNGSGCRETEQLVADVIADELKDVDLSYVVVNEAGASVYSTSDIGREELPGYDATLRGGISIGRRLLDPLSELVKINPSNIGVGLYQHDIKSKPLQASLDEVVRSCVNYVGVDVNTASSALLSYVSGLNQLTARRLYEYRCAHGPFVSREQLKEVPGVGEATFVQAAGFLKIVDGENPLDATWIHPESYDVAQRVLERIGSDLSELAARLPRTPPKKSQKVVSNEATNGMKTPETAANEEPPACQSSCQVDQGAMPAAAETEQGDATAETEQGDATAVTHEIHGTAVPADDDATVVTQRDQAPAASPEQSAPELDAETKADPVDQGPLAAQEAPAELSASTAKTGNGTSDLVERIKKIDVEVLSGELIIGRLLLQDILSALLRPGRDPREDLPPPLFRRGILKLEDLQPDMELSGTVLNVVDFGAFVDIGLSDTGLVHISRLADRYVGNPHEVVGVGDVLSLWVVSVDKQRRRISLTAIKPGTEKPRKPRQSERRPSPPSQPQRPTGSRRPRPFPSKSKTGEGQPRRGKRSRSDRPARPTKPVAPITKAMEEGKEPMRAFSDLKQFFDKQDEEDSGPSEQAES